MYDEILRHYFYNIDLHSHVIIPIKQTWKQYLFDVARKFGQPTETNLPEGHYKGLKISYTTYKRAPNGERNKKNV